MAEGSNEQHQEVMAGWKTIIGSGSLPTNSGVGPKQLATVVMGHMRDDETKLARQMKKLIKKHKSLAADILTSDIDGWTPLHACALRGSRNLLKVFLQSGAEVNTKMGQPEGLPGGCTLLHMAALRGDVRLLEFLLSKGARCDITDSCNMTPVLYAAKRKHRRAVRVLEENGACMNGVQELLSSNDGYDCISPQPSDKGFCFF